MARAPTSSVTNPSWFTPKRLYTVGSERDYGSLRFGSRNLGFVPLYRGLLAIFCIINLLNYIDRGTIASNGVNGSRRTCSKECTCSSGSGIHHTHFLGFLPLILCTNNLLTSGDFDLNNFEDGVISSAFMVGLLVASPIFASLAKSVNPFRLIGVGLTVWTLAVAFCGFSFNFWSIAISRMLVGVGEASFISLAAPFIDDNAPVAQRTAWLGTFYMCIPTGVAVGYVYGGLVGSFSWRLAFWLEAILMLPFAILGFVMKPLQLKGLSPGRSKIVLTVADGCSEDQGALDVYMDLNYLKAVYESFH
ncbi:putative sphingolipid transporter spinster2 [Sesamum angolense]|uniref:Sphingolipid transporter spinster2 n=1 Tax=Sesamum angolense TaxID=2727404 RepID=A0AAE1X4H5_9LAMI|nr:putative sphingolipid transporter spinster2 [Sesamum angolense]